MNSDNGHVDRRLVVDALLERARSAREDDPGEARRAALAAVEASRESGDGTLCNRSLNMLAQLERDAGETGRAVELYTEIAALCREAAHTRQRAHALRHVGDILRDEGRYDEAEDFYSEALDLYSGLPETPPLELANAVRGLALLRSLAGDGATAADLWAKARRLYCEAGVVSGFEECDEWLSGMVPDEPA